MAHKDGETRTPFLNIGKPTKVAFILKLSRPCREKFKKITHDQRTTMQEVIEAFVNSYIEDPARFSIKVNIEMKYIQNGKVSNDVPELRKRD